MKHIPDPKTLDIMHAPNSQLKLICLLGIIFFCHAQIQGQSRCDTPTIDPTVKAEAKRILRRSRSYLDAYRKLDLDGILGFVIVQNARAGTKDFIKKRLESSEANNPHLGVLKYCIDEMRPASDGYHSVITGRALYRNRLSHDEPIFFYVSLENNHIFFTHLMFSAVDTFHLSGAAPISEGSQER